LGKIDLGFAMGAPWVRHGCVLGSSADVDYFLVRI
jgi:hypothetical protein